MPKLKPYMLLLLFCCTANAFSQKKEKMVIIYDAEKMSFKDDRFVIDGQTFRYFPSQKASKVEYRDIEGNTSTIDIINSKVKSNPNYNKNKKEEFYYQDFFEIYVYKSEDGKSGILYPVERVWVVNTKIKD